MSRQDEDRGIYEIFKDPEPVVSIEAAMLVITGIVFVMWIFS